MSLLDVLNMVKSRITEYGGVVCVLIVFMFTMIQITPLKLNPWSAIGVAISKLISKLGQLLFSTFINKLDALETKVDMLSDVIDENEIDRIRWEILNFSNSCQRNINHTQNDFQHIFKINKKYHDILDRIGETNGEIDREMEYIDELYQQKKRDNSFLK